MKKILITGATGNIGFEVIKFMYGIKTRNEVIAGVRDLNKAKKQFAKFSNLSFRYLDFQNTESFESALEQVDSVFILRPPHISDVEKYFRPFIQKIKEKKISEVIFLSVQGAEKSKVIPHNKIEGLIKEYDLDHIFIRPAYFMQNLTTTLKEDILHKRKIFLPSGKAKFNWIDIQDIAETCAILLENFSSYKNRAIELTGYENLNFYEVVAIMNRYIKPKIVFQSVNPFRFYRIKKKEGMHKGMILVMLLLHFLPRFQKAPKISGFYEELTGKKPTQLIQFIEREKDHFLLNE